MLESFGLDRTEKLMALRGTKADRIHSPVSIAANGTGALARQSGFILNLEF